jgi:hypothetical protein
LPNLAEARRILPRTSGRPRETTPGLQGPGGIVKTMGLSYPLIGHRELYCFNFEEKFLRRITVLWISPGILNSTTDLADLLSKKPWNL